MGQRANYAIVENGQFRLFYSHWAANTLDRDLFWGPRHSLTFIRQQKELQPDDWLNDVWCEGGAVVDLDSNKLTLFGGEDIKYEIPLRRLYLRLLAKSWDGWEVNWADEGIADLADTAGYPRERVFARKAQTCKWRPLCAPDEESPWIDAIISTRNSSGEPRIYPIQAFTTDRLWEDPLFLESLLKMRSFERFSLPKEKGLPSTGVHLDLAARLFDIWTASPLPGLVDDLHTAWGGWKIQWHRDQFEFQEDAAQGCVQYPRFTDDELLPRIAAIVLRNLNPEGPVARFDSITAILKKEGHEITGVNKATLWHVDWSASREERQQIWEGILASLRLK